MTDSTVECDFCCFSPPALNYFLQSTLFFSFQNKARSCVPRMPVKRKGTGHETLCAEKARLDKEISLPEE